MKKRKAAENNRRGRGKQREQEKQKQKQTRASSVVSERPAHELLPRLRVTQRDELSAELLELATPVQQHLDLRRSRGRAVHNGLGLRTGLGTGLERRPLVCTRAADRPLVELRRGLSRTERPALGAGGSLGRDEGEHGECGGEAGGKCGDGVVVGGRGR